MAHRPSISGSRLLVAFTALALGAITAAGCGGNVVAGADDNGGGGGAGGGGAVGGAGGGNSGDACNMEGVLQSCGLPGDPPSDPTGTQQCEPSSDGPLVWSTCSAQSSGSTPLVLSFDGAPVDFVAGLGAFDVSGTASVVTDWPRAATPWLALDRDGNGAIDDGGELFGSATILRSGERARNGFVALAELDSNGDGKITPEDAAWPSLRLWADADGDRISSAGELASLGARRVLSIDLAYTSVPRCDDRGNCAVERAAFRWADASGVEHTGAIVDVHLKHQPLSVR
jgi:hypothetical protein